MAAPFPSRALSGLVTLGLAAASGCATYAVWHSALAPIQSYYLGTYLKAEYIPGFPFINHTPVLKSFPVLTVRGKDATLANTPGELDGLATRIVSIPAKDFAQWLRLAIFNGQSGFQFAAIPFTFWIFFLLLSMGAGALISDQEKRRAHEGKKLRGPDLISRWQFNRRVKGDGFPILLENKPNLFERFGGDKAMYLRLAQQYEHNHLLAMSDPGGGKTGLMFQILDEVARRGNEVAIIYDPHMQFTPRYFNAERGDIILNPLDARCPAWSPSAELDLSDDALAEAHAMAQATSLFPGSPVDRNWFFTYTSQLIWKYLSVNFQPTAHEMAHLMEHCEPLIDEAIKGTELETMMGKNAPQQRGAVLGHLTQIAYALRQLPAETDCKKLCVLKDWCETRHCWIFVTSTQKTRDSLRPIQSLWLDSLITNLLSQGARPDLSPVLMALDEMQTLQRLPQLMPLVTEGRKSLRVLMAFQGRSQLKALYGETAEAIFSAAYTKFFMRTSEDEASKWVSNTIGEVERERIRETRPAHAAGKGAHSYSTEHVTEKLLLPSEFHGLADREGYVKYGNLVVKIKMPIIPGVVNAPAFIPRPSVPVIKKTLPTLASIEPEPEIKEQTRVEYIAPPFLAIANNSTIHNKEVWSSAAVEQKSRKKIFPIKVVSVEPKT